MGIGSEIYFEKVVAEVDGGAHDEDLGILQHWCPRPLAGL